jgi:hypothetical protein
MRTCESLNMTSRLTADHVDKEKAGYSGVRRFRHKVKRIQGSEPVAPIMPCGFSLQLTSPNKPCKKNLGYSAPRAVVALLARGLAPRVKLFQGSISQRLLQAWNPMFPLPCAGTSVK